MSILRHTWNAFFADIQRIAPDATQTIHDENNDRDFLRYAVVNSDRLGIEAATTFDPSIAMLAGQVNYNKADRTGTTCVANIICRREGPDDTLTWSLTTYTSNYVARSDTSPALRGLKDQGVDMQALEQQLTAAAQRVAITPLVETSEALTSDILLTLLVESAKQHRGTGT